MTKVVLVLGMVYGFSANAQEPSEELCYPLIHGENGLGSRNSMFLPPLITNGDKWSSYIYITNASYESVNVKLEFLNYDGSTYIPYDMTYSGQFNVNNSPLNLNSGGAILGAHQTGWVSILDAGISHLTGFIGRVYWQADKCMDKAITVNIRNSYSSSTRYDQGYVTLNGGKPF